MSIYFWSLNIKSLTQKAIAREAHKDHPLQSPKITPKNRVKKYKHFLHEKIQHFCWILTAGGRT